MRESDGLPLAEVAIATPGGPSVIQALSREGDSVGRSRMSVRGSTRLTGISSAYGQYLSASGGLAKRLFGHATFRMDVSGAVDTGLSWQLPVLIAHGLEQAGRLHQSRTKAGDQAPPPEVRLIWADGIVSSETFAIREARDLGRKIDASWPLLQGARAEGRPVIVVIPAANLEQLPPSRREEMRGLGIELMPVRTAFEAFQGIGLDRPLPTAPPRRWRRAAWLAAAVVATALLVGAALLLGWGPPVLP